MVDLTADLLAFLHASPTPYHAVASAKERLESAGFRELYESDSWADTGPGRYFVTHAESAILAFVVPASSILRGFRIVGAHTDSPNFRLKPKPEYAKEGYLQLGVEVYGGMLLNSWLDRDLSLAGRVVQADGRTRLVRIDRPLLRVVQLAIHLDRDVNEKGLVLNRQEHLAPVLGLGTATGDEVAGLVAAELGIDRATIAALELMLFDTLPPAIGGVRNELIFSARLDNLACSHAAIAALVLGAAAAEGGSTVPVAALFDHEEVGSQSAAGAGSSFLPRVLERIALMCTSSRGVSDPREHYHRALAGSQCISADMAHAVHPNFADRHEARHRPVLNGGPVLKVNAQQRYATSARTGALFQELCRAVDVPVQHYVARTDLPCGSTIGPITSTLLGIPTVDVGNAMLSMHSAREMAGTKDPEMLTRVLTHFYGSQEQQSAVG